MDISHTPVGVRAPMPCNTIRLPTRWPTLREGAHRCLRSRDRWVAVRAVAERKRGSPFGADPKNIEPQFFRSPLAEQESVFTPSGARRGKVQQDSDPQLPLVDHVRGRGPR